MIDITTAINKLGITEWVLYGIPTSEEEFNSMFRKIVGVNENGTAKKSEDPKDFGITWSEVKAKQDELQADYNSTQYQRDRKQEYPTIEELVVALYDESDKASIIERRNAVKAKYPKPE